MNQKGIVLVLTSVIVAIVLVLTGVYLSGVISEKLFSERQRYVLQATGLAESGLSHGMAELRRQIRTDLQANIRTVGSSGVFDPYIIGPDDSINFLCDFAGFSRSGDEAILDITPLALGTGVQGSYSGRIIISKEKDDLGNPIEAYSPSANIYKFPYQFIIEGGGSVTRTTPAVQKSLRLVPGESGSAVNLGKFEITVQRGSFARFALYTSHHRAPSGVTVWFTEQTNFSGPVHTNERFSFAHNPGARFTQEVTQHQKRARFYNNGHPRLRDADSNPPLDIPSFNMGFLRGVDELVLVSAITQADLRREALGDMVEPGTNGIYFPNDGASLTGGIYVRGDSTIDMQVDGDENAVYTITQGADTVTATLDYTNNQTEIQIGASTETYSGLPDGESNEGVIIYTKGDVDSLSGTVQKDAQATISSERDIVITDHIRYQEYDSGPPPDAEGYTNLLGILSWGGDVRIGTAAPDDLDIHGIVMATHGIFTVDNYQFGSPRGEVNLLGGTITDFYGPFGTFTAAGPRSGYGRNFVYDARMLGGMAPPYFPVLTNFISVDDGGLDRKLVWEDRG